MIRKIGMFAEQITHLRRRKHCDAGIEAKLAMKCMLKLYMQVEVTPKFEIKTIHTLLGSLVNNR